MRSGIPFELDQRAIVQRCRVAPNRCTRRLLEFLEVQANELARGTFCVVMAVEATVHLRLECKASGVYFPHIDARYGIHVDEESPEPSEHEDGESSARMATTTVSGSSEADGASDTELADDRLAATASPITREAD